MRFHSLRFTHFLLLFPLLSGGLLSSCSHTTPPSPAIDSTSINAGTQVTQNGKPLELHAGSLQVGDNFLQKAKGLDLKFNNKVTVVNLVPSIDTAVCEVQTHQLAETEQLRPEVDRVLISRDLPMAQKRFAAESGLENLRYYSDYKDGSFGKETGTLIKGPELLTRGVLVLDREGVVRYMQLVSRIEQLPDMEKAFNFANQLAGSGA